MYGQKKVAVLLGRGLRIVKIDVVIKMSFLPLTVLSNYFFAMLGKFVQ